jgi:uncharacterized membrane protein YhhN
VILAYAGLVFLVLYRGLGRYRWPVLLYMLAISGMTWLSVCRHLGVMGRGSLLAMVGALLFLLSDSLNAFNRFKRPFRLAQVFILGAYFAAQLLLALSI